jgi:hypothetical protein
LSLISAVSTVTVIVPIPFPVSFLSIFISAMRIY